MGNIHEQFEQTVSLCHYGDDIYLLDEGQPLGELMPLVSGREIMTDKVVFLMCRSGLLHIRLNYHEMSLSAGQVFIALPGMIIDTLGVSPDFRATTMLLSERFTDSLNLGSSYRTLLSIHRQPVVTLMAGMEDAMLNFVGMVRGLLTLPSHPNLDRVVHLLRVVVLRFRPLPAQHREPAHSYSGRTAYRALSTSGGAKLPPQALARLVRHTDEHHSKETLHLRKTDLGTQRHRVD